MSLCPYFPYYYKYLIFPYVPYQFNFSSNNFHPFQANRVCCHYSPTCFSIFEPHYFGLKIFKIAKLKSFRIWWYKQCVYIQDMYKINTYFSQVLIHKTYIDKEQQSIHMEEFKPSINQINSIKEFNVWSTQYVIRFDVYVYNKNLVRFLWRKNYHSYVILSNWLVKKLLIYVRGIHSFIIDLW